MIDLYEFYFKNIKEEDYYYRFYSSIKNVNKTYNIFTGEQETSDYEFKLYDIDEIIEKFRSLCEPNCSSNSSENFCWFYLICYYLNYNGYYIEQFKSLLNRPPIEPYDFTYTMMRNYLINNGKSRNGSVPYSERRLLASQLEFKLNSTHLEISENIDEIFKKISTRNASFQEMATDEKLKEIINFLENIMKKDKAYIKLEYSEISFDYINDDFIKKYKNQIQCFRHASEQALLERKAFTELQKEFLIDLGIIIIKVVYNAL